MHYMYVWDCVCVEVVKISQVIAIIAQASVHLVRSICDVYIAFMRLVCYLPAKWLLFYAFKLNFMSSCFRIITHHMRKKCAHYNVHYKRYLCEFETVQMMKTTTFAVFFSRDFEDSLKRRGKNNVIENENGIQIVSCDPKKTKQVQSAFFGQRNNENYTFVCSTLYCNILSVSIVNLN